MIDVTAALNLMAQASATNRLNTRLWVAFGEIFAYKPQNACPRRVFYLPEKAGIFGVEQREKLGAKQLEKLAD